MHHTMSFRRLFFIGALASSGLLGGAYFLQYHFLLEPCPLCLLQRYVIWGIVCLFWLGVLYAGKQMIRTFYYFFILLLSLFGILLAGRHLWLQHLPPSNEIPTCTAGFEKMLAYTPLWEAIKTALQESPSCMRIDFTILGFSLSFWSLLYFVGLTVFIFYIIQLQIKRRI